MQHLDKCCHVFYEWPLNAVLHKKLSWWLFCRKYCTIKDGAQTYDFIADKICLLFSIILKIVHWKWMRSYQITGKMYKNIKEFLKSFCAWAKPHSSEGRLWSYLNIVHMRLYLSGMTDDWEYGPESLWYPSVFHSNPIFSFLSHQSEKEDTFWWKMTCHLFLSSERRKFAACHLGKL